MNVEKEAVVSATAQDDQSLDFTTTEQPIKGENYPLQLEVPPPPTTALSVPIAPPPPMPPYVLTKTKEQLVELLAPWMRGLECRRWLLWRGAKVPYYANGKPRAKDIELDSPEDVAQFVTFDEAYDVFAKGGYTGLGFALGPDGHGGCWQGLDFDHFKDNPHLHQLKLFGYVESSPSGDGFHAIGYGREFRTLGKNGSGIEAYSERRYFTVTGNGGIMIGIETPNDAVCLADYVEILSLLHTLHGTKNNNTQTTHAKGSALNPKVLETLPPETMYDLRSALFYMSADEYELWIAMGQALCWVEGGQDLWSEWSATSDSFKGEEDLKKWDSFRGDHSGYKVVFARAQANGWSNPGNKYDAVEIFRKQVAHPHVGSPAGDNQESLTEDNSQASLMVTFVTNRCELFHDKNKDVYAQNRITKETRRLDGRPFKDWLVANFYESSGKSPREQSVREAISTLSGLARFKGKRNEVHIRVAEHDGDYFLDLGEPAQSRVIRITSGRWEILSDPPVCFLRPETLQPLPVPIGGGDLSRLWQLINIPEDSRLLVIAWLCECLRPNTPFPVLELIGEQGSAKSTTQTVLRRLIDPNICDLRAAPKVVDDIFVSAGVTWLVSYENISHLSAPMQDSLCVLATGGGFAKRKLYTDADEAVINVKRPVILNGISVAITAQDLIDRTLSIETPVIQVRTESTQLQNDFDSISAELLGSLLDAMAKALEILPSMNLPPEERPRLLEFAHFGMAIAQAMGYSGGDFTTQFNTRRQESIARTIDASPVASAMIEWCSKQSTTIELPMKELYQALLSHKPHHSDAWPHSPKGLGDALRRLAPALRQLGIACKSLGKRGSHVHWEIKPRI